MDNGQSGTPLNETGTVPTLDDIAARLRILANGMQELATDMIVFGAFNEVGDHGVELLGASHIARTWASGMVKEVKDAQV
jgi:hypothetical protein